MTENKRFRISQGYTDRFCHDWKTNKLLDFKQTIDYLNTLYDENEELKRHIKHSEKRTAIISGWLHDEGNMTLDKYEEILDYCYREYKKENI